MDGSSQDNDIICDIELGNISLKDVIKKVYQKYNGKNTNESENSEKIKDEIIKDINESENAEKNESENTEKSKDLSKNNETENTEDKKDINEKNSVFVCQDSFFGKIYYELCKNEIIIDIRDFNEKVKIFKEPVKFFNEEDKQIYEVYNKDSLETSLKFYSDKYLLFVDNKIQTSSEILENIPNKIILKIKENENLLFDIFKSINKKEEMPKDKGTISIDTNKLVTQNINSLGIRRNEQFHLIINSRNELIKEIQDFMDSEEIIMKIFGCDGVGKSISFIYLTSLKNNFKTVYFNLKEFHNAENSRILEIFKYQLMNYYISQNILEDKKEKIYKKNFDLFSEKIESIEKELNKCQLFDFWDLFEIISKKMNILYKVVFIFDQYKEENDKYNRLLRIEKKIISLKNIKLIVASSLNDMKVKYDFINILKYYLKATSKIKEQTEENEGKDNRENDLTKLELFNDIFNEYNPEKNYLEKDDEEDENFKKIKIFNDVDDNKIDENIEKKQNNENKPINNIFINYNQENLFNYNEKYRILYINNLISVQNINDIDNKENKENKENKQNKEKEIIEKLEDFDYNPKYYNKLKDFYNKNIENSNINNIYANFLHNTYDNIKEKIKNFYDNYNIYNRLSVSFPELIAKKLINLYNLIQTRTKLNLKLLIHYLNQFPVKYIKIFVLDNETEIEIKKKFFRLNKDLVNKKFRLEFSFPFIKFTISRLIFEIGNNCIFDNSDISPSGFGSLLEKQIRKAIIIDKILETFYLRNVWSFNTTSNEKEKTKTKIDFFNFENLNFDDKNKNPLKEFYANYYIIPHSSNNKLLDSIILIPIGLNNKKDKKFKLVSLQITINKNNIYNLDEYHNETCKAANLIKNIYDIIIEDKYFVFVLSKDYNNSETQKILIKLEIPFIFFSSIENCFYLNKNTKINSVVQFFDEKYKIQTIKDKQREESIFKKKMKFNKMSLLLEDYKREKKISKNFFIFLKNVMFNNEKELILPKNEKRNIIESIQKHEWYKNKKITIEYLFRAHFLRNEELSFYEELLGLVFYKNAMFLINNKLDSKIIMHKDFNPKKGLDKLSILLLYANRKPIDIKEENEDIKNFCSNEKPEFNDLIKYNMQRPSDIFIFAIYEIN